LAAGLAAGLAAFFGFVVMVAPSHSAASGEVRHLLRRAGAAPLAAGGAGGYWILSG